MDEELAGFRRQLEARMLDLSKSQQRSATYLLTSYDEAAFLSAADLARRLQMSEATVVRFVKAIGYDGFPELRRAIQDLYRGQAAPAAPLHHKLAELAGGQGHILPKVLDMEIQYLAEAEHSISTADFDRAVEIILNGRHDGTRAHCRLSRHLTHRYPGRGIP